MTTYPLFRYMYNVYSVENILSVVQRICRIIENMCGTACAIVY